MSMNTIRLTGNDIRIMVNEAVRRTLGRKSLNESYWPPFDRREGRKSVYNPYPRGIWGSREIPQWHEDNGEKLGFDEEKMRASILEDVEDFKYGMEKVIAKVKGIKAWAVKNNVGPKGVRTALANHVGIGERGKIGKSGYSGSGEIERYVNAKKEATDKGTWDIIEEYASMSPEERDADIREFLVPALEKWYRTEYGEYSGDFDKAVARRGEIERNLTEFLEKYSDVDPSQMSYVELLEAKKDIFDFSHNNSMNSSTDAFFKERGLDWDALRTAIGNEIGKRYDSVPHFYFCENDRSYSPERRANYEKQWEEYQKLLAKTNAHSLKDRERSSSYGESMRGYHWSTGELVDDNDNLVCTVRFETDSSD